MVLSAIHKDSEHGIPHYMGMSGRQLQLAISTIATCGFLLFGYDQGVMSGIISAPAFNDAFPDTRDNPTWQGFVTSIYEIGCLFGAIFQLCFGDKIGRRRAIALGGTVMILGVILQVAAMPGHGAEAQFIIGRIVTGIGNGINTSTIPTYQAECSRSTKRGLLICIEGGVIAFGTLIAYWIDYGCSYGPTDLVWRFPIAFVKWMGKRVPSDLKNHRAFQCIFGFVIVFGMIWLPESPRWLLTRERHEEAMTVLAALHGEHRESDDVKMQANIINDSIRASGHTGGNTPYSALFTRGKTQHFRRMMLGVSSQFMQQIGGCNAVIYYFPILFETSIVKGKHDLALLLGGVNMVVYAIFATTSWFVIERVGRRKLFLIGSIGQCLSMVLVFGALIPDTVASNKGAAVGLFTYIAFFGATWLPLPWLYPAEVNPIKTRAKANAVSTCTNWLWNFAVVMFTPPFVAGSAWGCYLFFAVCNALFVPVIYFFYPETAGRTLEEIDVIFAKGFSENMSYVRAAKELPKLSDDEIDAQAQKYGFTSSDDEAGQTEARFVEKEDELAPPAAGGQMV